MALRDPDARRVWLAVFAAHELEADVRESPKVSQWVAEQNALTESMTVEEAANDAADRINELIASR